MSRVLLCCVLLLTLTGCAGRHVRPDSGYAMNEPQMTLRVAFDQAGHIYPRDAEQVPWDTVELKPVGAAFGRYSLRLAEIKGINGQKPYTEELRAAIQRDAIDRLNRMLENQDTLVILIHGFNEQYDDAKKNFDTFRTALHPVRHPILEVYWDGLTIPFRENAGEFSGLSRLSFWPEAVLYSSLAGQFGLRPLLEGIERPVDVRILTFSRGAAVALSAVSNSKFDDQFKDRYAKAPFAMSNPRLRSVKMGLVAAAVGTGHINDDSDARLGQPVDVISGLNPRDFAVSKTILPTRTYGDTSLGGDREYLLSEIALDRKMLQLQGVEFKHGSSHSLPNYTFKNGVAGQGLTPSMSCLLYLLDLRPQADACTDDVWLPKYPDPRR